MTTRPDIELGTMCLDCHDAHEMAHFYGGLLGWVATLTEPDWVLMRNPAGGMGLSFQADPAYVSPVWPEVPEAQQKMMHLDVRVTPPAGADPSGPAGQEALDVAAELAVDVGGRLAPHQPREDLRIILDPAGHPLCLFVH
jgi:hypothetical protein